MYKLHKVRLQERAAAHKLVAASLCLDLLEHTKGDRTGKGHSLEEGRDGGRALHSRLVPKSCRKKVKI